MQSSERQKAPSGWCDAMNSGRDYWTYEDYTQRKADLEAMLRRFQWYLISNTKQSSPISDASILKTAELVFVSGVDFEHILYGSTGVTSCPLFEILNSDWDIERRVGDNTTPLYHAYAIQCGGDETLALCKDEILRDLDLPKNELFPQELRQAKRMMDDGEKICTQIATEGPKEGAVKEEWNELVRHRDNALAELPQILHKAFGHGDDFFFVNGRLRFSLRMLMGNSHGFPPPGRLPTDYWYAMDTSELRAELSALLPLAERLDRQQQIMDSTQSLHFIIATAIEDIDHDPESQGDFLVLDYIQHIAVVCPCKSFPACEGSWLDFGVKFLIASVASHYNGFREFKCDCCKPGHEAWGRIESLQRRLRLLKSYLLNPLSEPNLKRKREDGEESKQQLLSSHARALQEVKSLRRSSEHYFLTANKAEHELSKMKRLAESGDGSSGK